ncbi:MAG TPA: type II toxin-antitoxin system HicB family antitoxin [Tepidisphaeraceae bacterium]|jgi:predicted RNase H-like HicB family nuclease|nr:type II toxin-antitoxin system HicB family antitoxin [Tepidisphaeraceae bacterium]
MAKTTLNFPIVIHKDPHSDYGVSVPDLPGCFSAGSTIEEAMTMAQEAIEFHLEGIIADGQAIPRPKPIERHVRSRDYKGGTWAVVSVEVGHLLSKAVRINITLPEKVLRSVDHFAQAAGETRSGLLAAAATQYIKARTQGKFRK